MVEYMIIGTDGGKIGPTVEDAAVTPAENYTSYPFSFIASISI